MVDLKINGDATETNVGKVQVAAGIARAVIQIGYTPGTVKVNITSKNLDGTLNFEAK